MNSIEPETRMNLNTYYPIEPNLSDLEYIRETGILQNKMDSITKPGYKSLLKKVTSYLKDPIKLNQLRESLLICTELTGDESDIPSLHSSTEVLYYEADKLLDMWAELYFKKIDRTFPGLENNQWIKHEKKSFDDKIRALSWSLGEGLSNCKPSSSCMMI